MRIFRKKLPPHIPVYDSIENLPIYNWNKVNEKADYSYVKVNRINGQVSKEEYALLKKTWEKIFSEFIGRFGFSENFLNITLKKKQIAFLQWQFIESSDRSIHTFIDIAKKELTELEKENSGYDFWKSKSQIEQVLKFHINPKETTVVEYYSHIEELRSQRQTA